MRKRQANEPKGLRSKQRRPNWLRLALALTVLLFGRGATAAQTQETNAKPEEKDDVALAGHMARSVVRTDDSVRFWITIRNRTGGALQHIRIVHQDTPGFGDLRPCWGSNVDATCGLPADTDELCKAPGNSADPGSRGNLLCAYLNPGGAFTIWGDLPANAAEFRHRNFLVLSWDDGSGKRTLSSVDLGESETVSRWLSPIIWLRGKPEVTIPAALTLLGLLAAWLAAGANCANR